MSVEREDERCGPPARPVPCLCLSRAIAPDRCQRHFGAARKVECFVTLRHDDTAGAADDPADRRTLAAACDRADDCTECDPDGAITHGLVVGVLANFAVRVD